MNSNIFLTFGISLIFLLQTDFINANSGDTSLNVEPNRIVESDDSRMDHLDAVESASSLDEGSTWGEGVSDPESNANGMDEPHDEEKNEGVYPDGCTGDCGYKPDFSSSLGH
ncbi:hypothetical protein DdX_15980 [Ditylenchus destructor]|uniref:Secreted protein n=1 Tax=Ditylenchus destructor TaxID=166010 RepID=A0AAD4R0A3_9BILA|nr:hypothetical protein DdX_15980 [Ditylenchus destructor]